MSTSITITISRQQREWVEARIAQAKYESLDDIFGAALEALRSDEDQHDTFIAGLGGGFSFDPDAMARGRKRFDELIDEGLNSGDAGPLDMEEIIRDAKEARRKRAA